MMPWPVAQVLSTEKKIFEKSKKKNIQKFALKNLLRPWLYPT